MKTPTREKRLSKRLLIPVLLIEIAVTQLGLLPPAQAKKVEKEKMQGPPEIEIWCQIIPWLPMCIPISPPSPGSEND